MRLAKRFGKILLHAWPQKLAALILATFIWLFVNVNDTSTTQRSLFVPLTVEGLAIDSVATGLPDFVELTVAGPSVQIDRLRPENFEARIDLAGERGDFEVPIDVLLPQGVDLRRIDPSDVIGTVEAVTVKQVPVDSVLLSTGGQDVRTIVSVEPLEVTVRARSSTLDQVAAVLAPVAANPGETTVTPFAVTATGQPVSGVVVQPPVLTVTVVQEPILITREVPVDLDLPSMSGYTVTARMDEPSVTVTGPPSAVAALESVPGSVTLPTGDVAAGGYTLPVTVQLPDGVSVRGNPTATVRLSRTQVQP